VTRHVIRHVIRHVMILAMNPRMLPGRIPDRDCSQQNQRHHQNRRRWCFSPRQQRICRPNRDARILWPSGPTVPPGG